MSRFLVFVFLVAFVGSELGNLSEQNVLSGPDCFASVPLGFTALSEEFAQEEFVDMQIAEWDRRDTADCLQFLNLGCNQRSSHMRSWSEGDGSSSRPGTRGAIYPSVVTKGEEAVREELMNPAVLYCMSGNKIVDAQP